MTLEVSNPTTAKLAYRFVGDCAIFLQRSGWRDVTIHVPLPTSPLDLEEQIRQRVVRILSKDTFALRKTHDKRAFIRCILDCKYSASGQRIFPCFHIPAYQFESVGDLFIDPHADKVALDVDVNLAWVKEEKKHPL